MSAVLLVTNARKQATKAHVRHSGFTIGRSKECDLPLDEPMASRQHVEITLDQGVFWVRDCGSSNGTSLNGQKLSNRCPLRDGDEIAIGSTRLKFFQDDHEEVVADPAEDVTRPAGSAVPVSVPPVVQEVSPDAEPGPEQRMSVPPKEGEAQGKKRRRVRVTVRVIEGPGKGAVFRDWEGDLTIGRAMDNLAVILDDRVSGHHARIVEEDGSYVVESLSEHNPTFLDKVVVQRAALLNGQKIGIAGAATLSFDLVDLQKRRRVLTVALTTALAMALLLIVLKFVLPPDYAAQHMAKGRQFKAQGEFAKAKREFEMALKMDPRRKGTEKELKSVEDLLAASESLFQAETNAAAGNFEKARNLVYQAQRLDPKNTRAQELEATIQSIEEAKIAFDNRNWGAAVNKLQKAQEKDPESELINDRFKAAVAEMAAGQHLASAKEALQQKQLQMAEDHLAKVPTNSVFWVEATKYLQQIGADRVASRGIDSAQNLYRAGRLSEALAELDTVLKASPEHSTARELQVRCRKMAALAGPLKAAEDLQGGTTADANVLMEARKTCDEVLDLEPDPLNVLRKTAQDARARIEQVLQAFSQASAAQALELLRKVPTINTAEPETLLKPENLKNIGELKKAWELLVKAINADRNNETALQATNSVHERIVRVSQSLYKYGAGIEDFGSQKYKDIPRECYSAVIAIGLPGEHYYELAKKKVR